MKDIQKLKAHIATLRQLASAAESLERARNANAELLPRTGIRGGRATTNNARHDKAAEHYWKLENKAEEESINFWDMCKATDAIELIEDVYQELGATGNVSLNLYGRIERWRK